MKQALIWIAVLILVCTGCKGRETKAAAGATETIAPAQPKPAATDSDVTTQTVDIEDSRSEGESTTAKSTTKPATGTTENPTTTAAPPTTTTH